MHMSQTYVFTWHWFCFIHPNGVPHSSNNLLILSIRNILLHFEINLYLISSFITSHYKARLQCKIHCTVDKRFQQVYLVTYFTANIEQSNAVICWQYVMIHDTIQLHQRHYITDSTTSTIHYTKRYARVKLCPHLNAAHARWRYLMDHLHQLFHSRIQSCAVLRLNCLTIRQYSLYQFCHV